MTDFETHPAGTAARIEQLEAQNKELGDFLAAYMAEAFTAGRTVTELREAITRANAATAAACEVMAKKADNWHVAYISGKGRNPEKYDSTFSYLSRTIRALATPDQTAALDELIAEAVDSAAETAAQFVHKRLYEANMPACSYHSREIKDAILAARKKGGAA